ncbi:MFS transporter [Catenulispora subtropica]|uniref:Major facilitator superfamily (MFS) profile domain-containing protein n=1 Tax=Catenulispora subtropica TaxID=450798 RepID=A0ABN2SI38_9ACTN
MTTDSLPGSAPAGASAARTTAPAVPRPLVLACFLSNFDRFAITPMLVVLSAAFHVRLGSAVLVASGYFFAYGCAQPVWGVLSDRHGRLRIARVALGLAAGCATCSALAPNLSALIVLRTATGAAFGGVVPTSLAYVGDTVPVAVRQRALSDLQLALAVGTAGATVTAGAGADLVDWRTVFVVPGALAAVLAVRLRTAPEGPRTDAVALGPGQRIAAVLKIRWSWLVMGLGLVEGALLLGGFTFLAAALEHRGLSAARAGLVTALYGAGTIVFSRLLRLVATRAAWTLTAAGGLMMCAGFAAAAADQSPAAVSLAAILLGGGWSFLHSSLQTWATTLTPDARGTSVALFVASLFVGSAVGSALGSPLADRGEYGALFGISTLIAIPLTLAAAVGRRRYSAHA